MKFTIDLSRNSHTISIGYGFQYPGLAIVEEEYLVYNFIGMISSIGGSLGLFIGFSCTQFISGILFYLQTLFKKMDQKYYHHCQRFKRSRTNEVDPIQTLNQTNEVTCPQDLKLKLIEAKIADMKNLIEKHDAINSLRTWSLRRKLEDKNEELRQCEEKIQKLENLVNKTGRILGIFRS